MFGAFRWSNMAMENSCNFMYRMFPIAMLDYQRVNIYIINTYLYLFISYYSHWDPTAVKLPTRPWWKCFRKMILHLQAYYHQKYLGQSKVQDIIFSPVVFSMVEMCISKASFSKSSPHSSLTWNHWDWSCDQQAIPWVLPDPLRVPWVKICHVVRQNGMIMNPFSVQE